MDLYLSDLSQLIDHEISSTCLSIQCWMCPSFGGLARAPTQFRISGEVPPVHTGRRHCILSLKCVLHFDEAVRISLTLR